MINFFGHAAARRTAPVFLVVLLVVVAGLACSSQSPNIGKFYKGRILHVSVAALERTDELRWTTSTRYPAQGAVDEPLYRITPQSAENELVLVRVKVENHTATSAIVNVDRDSAQLRDFFQGRYSPINVGALAQEADVPEKPSDRCNVPVNPETPSECVRFLWNATYEEAQLYGGDLSTTSVPDISAFTVRVNGTEVALVGDPVVSSNTVTLTLADGVASKDIVTVSYNGSVENRLQDRAGNSVAALDDQFVTHIEEGFTPLVVMMRNIDNNGAFDAVAATDNYNSDVTYWWYRIQPDETCANAPPDDAQDYIEGKPVNLTDDHIGQYVCFWSNDIKSGYASQGRSTQVRGTTVQGQTPPDFPETNDTSRPSLYSAMVDGGTLMLVYTEAKIVQRAQELPKGTGLDGWMVFEVPRDTEFRSFRWGSGDTIIVDF